MSVVAMEAKKVIYCYSVLLLLAIVNGHGAWAIPGGEDIGLESQLSIEHDGDIYDCVDINKQPTLGHSLFKNHKVQMKPTGSFPKSTIDDSSITSDDQTVEIGLGEGCPLGTVPIQRTRKEDLKGAKEAFFKSYSEQPDAKIGFGYFRAEEQTTLKPSSKYYGAQAYLNVYNPAMIGPDPQSNVIIKLFFGPEDSCCTTLAAGWAIFPGIYKDNSTRLHTFWSTAFEQRLCYNIRCPGFVQTSRKIALGMKIHNVSKYHGKQYDIKLTIYKDSKKGHWWLLYGRNDEPIGYWPKGLLRNFTSHATTAVWGGTAVGEDPFPPMGSGHKFTKSPQGGYGSACYIRGMKVVEKLGGNFTDVNDRMLTKFENRPICYNVGGQGFSKEWGYGIFVGGAGGLCGYSGL
ncbi:hypothetical protein AAG906_027398 [Vitis piasezkii]